MDSFVARYRQLCAEQGIEPLPDPVLLARIMLAMYRRIPAAAVAISYDLPSEPEQAD